MDHFYNSSITLPPVDYETLGKFSIGLQIALPYQHNLTARQITVQHPYLVDAILKAPLSMDHRLEQFHELYNKTFGANTSAYLLPEIMKNAHYDNNRTYIFQYLVATPIVILIIMLRLWSRMKIMGRMLPGDWAVLMALIFICGAESVFLCDRFIGGGGKHVWDITYRDFRIHFLCAYIAQIMYFPIAALIKISLLLFYQTMSRSRQYRIASVSLMVFIGIVTFIIVLCQIFVCQPLNWWSDPFQDGLKCIDKIALSKAEFVFAFSTDMAVVLFPIPVVLKLQMSRKKRAGVLCLTMLGSFGSFCTVLTFITVLKYIKSYDFTYTAMQPTLWFTMEIHLGIVCGSIPALRALYYYYRPHTELTTSDSQQKVRTTTTVDTNPTYPCSIETVVREEGLGDDIV